MQEIIVGPGDDGLRLDVWLVRRTEAGSRARASEWIERGKIFLNGREAAGRDRATRVGAGDRVGLWIDRPGSSRSPDAAVAGARPSLRVVYEDASIAIVDKPAGLLVEPLPRDAGSEPTVLDLLLDRARHLARARYYVVHRIDRDTSGLVLFARTAAARDRLKAQFEAQTPERVYLAVTLGQVRADSGTWRDRLAWDTSSLRQRRAHGKDAGGKEAVSRYRVRERFGAATLLEVSLVTGKRNQIRVQAAMRGHPLLGERQYRFGAIDEPADLPRIGRQALHAWRLSFHHPESGRRVGFVSEVPSDLDRLLRALDVLKTKIRCR
ncbi:MAG: RluA family pseudouridine synthase [Acidobacteriota bacterium]